MNKKKKTRVTIEVGPRGLFTLIRLLERNYVPYPGGRKVDNFLSRHWDAMGGGMSFEDASKLLNRLIDLANTIPEYRQNAKGE